MGITGCAKPLPKCHFNFLAHHILFLKHLFHF